MRTGCPLGQVEPFVFLKKLHAAVCQSTFSNFGIKDQQISSNIQFYAAQVFAQILHMLQKKVMHTWAFSLTLRCVYSRTAAPFRVALISVNSKHLLAILHLASLEKFRFGQTFSQRFESTKAPIGSLILLQIHFTQITSSHQESLNRDSRKSGPQNKCHLSIFKICPSLH